MKIAAVTEDGMTISPHFGRAKYIVLTLEDGKISGGEHREKMGHSHFASQHHENEKADPRGHGFSQAGQDRHFRMVEAIRDCQFLPARGMGAGAYYRIEQVGIRPIITDIASIEEAGLQVAQGLVVDHKEKLH